MLVLLRENIANLGRIGDIIKVSDGYARNFLLPRKLVVEADESNVLALEHHKKLLAKKREASKSQAEQIAKKLEEVSCTISRKVGEKDKLFGSVSTADIADGLKKAGFTIDRKMIELDQPIKTLGVHAVKVQLEPEVAASVKVWVVKEEG